MAAELLMTAFEASIALKLPFGEFISRLQDADSEEAKLKRTDDFSNYFISKSVRALAEKRKLG